MCAGTWHNIFNNGKTKIALEHKYSETCWSAIPHSKTMCECLETPVLTPLLTTASVTKNDIGMRRVCEILHRKQTHRSWTQETLPPKSGGLGLHLCSPLASITYISSIIDKLPLLTQILRSQSFPAALHIGHHVANLNRQLEFDSSFQLDSLLSGSASALKSPPHPNRSLAKTARAHHCTSWKRGS